MQQLPDLSQLTTEEKDELIRPLFAAVQALTARVRELEGLLSKNSKNSSKPPSSDGLKKTTSLRTASGKRPGGQVGHIGKTLQPVEAPDKIVRLELPAHCDVCAAPLAGELAEIDQRRQVIDIPVLKYEVTEYRTLSLRCPCGKLHSSEFAAEIDEGVQYGPNIRSLAVHLTQGQLLPLARSCELLRGMEAITELGILPHCTGRLVHDCLAAYWQLEDKEHSLCGAHLLRELAFEQQTGGQPWSQQMALTLCDALKACDAAQAAGAKALPAAEIETFTARYRAGIQAGQALNPPAAKIAGRRGRAKQSTAFNLLRRLREHEPELLFFMHDLAVPFTNNLAERAIRMPKVKQRISGCFRTFRGAKNFCSIRSYLDTARKHGYGMLQALQAAFSGISLNLA